MQARTLPDFSEIGAPGTQIFAGLMMQTDYSPDLQPPACYDVFDRMRKGDGQVRAGLQVMKLPIMRAHWEVEPASDSAQDRMIAEFIERDLHSMRGTTYQRFLRQALMMLDYGCMPFEPVWELHDDGLVHLKKLAQRLPKSVIYWLTDENGGFAGIVQGAIKASGYERVTIPASKMIVFVNEQEGADFRGTSMLRAAYKHWFYKDGLYRVDAIAKEKRAVGVDVMTIMANAQDKGVLKTASENALMTLHAHEKNFVVEDEAGYKYRLETGSNRPLDALGSIEHHDLRILRAMMAEFVSMGSGSTGSLAMHGDKTRFALMAWEAISQDLADVQTNDLIRPWVDLNWSVQDYPRVRYSRLDTRDVQTLATAVASLATVGAIPISAELQSEMLNVLDLPGGEPVNQPWPDPNDPPQREPLPEPAVSVYRRQVERLKAEAPKLFRTDKPIALGRIEVPYREEMAERLLASTGNRARARAHAAMFAELLRATFEDEMTHQLEAGNGYDAPSLDAVLNERLLETVAK